VGVLVTSENLLQSESIRVDPNQHDLRCHVLKSQDTLERELKRTLSVTLLIYHKGSGTIMGLHLPHWQDTSLEAVLRRARDRRLRLAAVLRNAAEP
jgi:hypothetical protein